MCMKLQTFHNSIFTKAVITCFVYLFFCRLLLLPTSMTKIIKLKMKQGSSNTKVAKQEIMGYEGKFLVAM